MTASLSFLTEGDFWLTVAILAAIYGIAALGVQLNAGTSGIINFGPAGFMALGVYVMAVLATTYRLNFWLALASGIAVAMVFGFLIGLLALRLRADYFAITTLAFAEIVHIVTLNWRNVTNGDQGIIGFDATWTQLSSGIADSLGRVGISSSYLLPLAVSAWALFLLNAIILRLLVSTPWGRVLKAIKSDEDAARSIGKRTLGYKLQSLCLGSALYVLAGVFLALNLAVIVPEAFDSEITILAYAIVVLSGLGSYVATLGGAVILLTILEGTRYLDLPLAIDKIASLRLIIVGVILVLFMVFRPQGTFGRAVDLQ